MEISSFKVGNINGYFINVPNDSDNFDLSSSYDLNITEISFDDSTNYCRMHDALMFEGVYDLGGFVDMEGKKYLIISEVRPLDEIRHDKLDKLV